jgi:hypothetical protein
MGSFQVNADIFLIANGILPRVKRLSLLYIPLHWDRLALTVSRMPQKAYQLRKNMTDDKKSVRHQFLYCIMPRYFGKQTLKCKHRAKLF